MKNCTSSFGSIGFGLRDLAPVHSHGPDSHRRCSNLHEYPPNSAQRPGDWLSNLTYSLAFLLALALATSVNANSDVFAEISRIESESGAYSAKLSEHLLTLASHYQEKGKHQNAIEVYKRAIHVQRINEGLYNLNQVTMIERMIDSQIALGDWEEAADRHSHLFWLHQRNFGEDDPRMLPVLDKMSSWHLNAYAISPVNQHHHLSNAYEMFQRSIGIVTKHHGETDTRLIKPLQGLAISNYYLARLNAQQQPRRASSTPTHEGAITFRNSAAAEAERRSRIDHYMLNSYHSGKQAIQQMIEIFRADDDGDPANQIRAQVQLGDWYMLFDRPNSATDEYQAAYQAMSQYEHLNDYKTQVFGQPRALPDLPNIQAETRDANDPHDYVVVQYDVTARGDARNIEFLESKPKNSVGNRVMVRRSLKVAKFRPRFDQGEPVDTQGIVHRYIIPK